MKIKVKSGDAVILYEDECGAPSLALVEGLLMELCEQLREMKHE